MLEKATAAAQAADLCIVLGTSMVVKPMNHFPYCAKKFVIVNLQEGPMDNEAWYALPHTQQYHKNLLFFSMEADQEHTLLTNQLIMLYRLVIRGTCDEVLGALADKLGIEYTRPTPNSQNKIMDLPAWAVRAANNEEQVEEEVWE